MRLDHLLSKELLTSLGSPGSGLAPASAACVRRLVAQGWNINYAPVRRWWSSQYLHPCGVVERVVAGGGVEMSTLLGPEGTDVVWVFWPP